MVVICFKTSHVDNSTVATNTTKYESLIYGDSWLALTSKRTYSRGEYLLVFCISPRKHSVSVFQNESSSVCVKVTVSFNFSEDKFVGILVALLSFAASIFLVLGVTKVIYIKVYFFILMCHLRAVIRMMEGYTLFVLLFRVEQHSWCRFLAYSC
jgi:hypothetical protein